MTKDMILLFTTIDHMKWSLTFGAVIGSFIASEFLKSETDIISNIIWTISSALMIILSTGLIAIHIIKKRINHNAL